jgi:PLP dependent protein
MFNKNSYEQIKSEIPENVRILAATKTKFIGDIIEAVNEGIKIVGENYVQEAEAKYGRLKDFFSEKNVSFHLIGHLQSNKIKDAVKIFDCIETLDSPELAEKIDSVCQELNKKIDVMIEINFDESQKSGINLSELDLLIAKINISRNLILVGIMCIPPIGKEKESFEKMKELKEKYNFKELSIGMSSDYKLAIEYGATIIRLGTILFGKR